MITEPVRIVPPGPLATVAIVLAIPVGQLCHELCHWLAAWALGGDPTLHLAVRSPMVTSYDVDSDGADGIVKLMPLYVGMALLCVVLLALGGWPPESAWTLAGALWWATLTWPSYEDRAPFRTLETPDTINNDVIKATVGLLLLIVLSSSPYSRNPFVWRFVILPLLGATLGLWALGIHRVETGETFSSAYVDS